MKYEFRDNEVKTVHTETKLLADQIRANSAVDLEVSKFIQLEKKKFKKTDDLGDMIHRD